MSASCGQVKYSSSVHILGRPWLRSHHTTILWKVIIYKSRGWHPTIECVFKPVFEFYIHFKANFSHYYVNQIFSEDPRKLNMKNCKPTQYQPKSQILFHKIIRLCDLYIMTLIISMLYIWTIARFCQFYISIFTSLHRTVAFQKRYIHNINFKNVCIPSCIHKSIPNHKDFPEILWKL